MVPLADVLELIYRSRTSFRTVVAAGDGSDGRHRLWVERPDLFRWERDGEDGTLTVVQAGDRWWLSHPAHGFHTNEGDPSHGVDHGPLVWLLDPTPLLGAARLEMAGSAEVAGRAAALLRALPRRPGEEAYLPGWSFGPEPFDLAIDLERGVALRWAGETSSRGFTEIAFDVDIPEERFTPNPSEGPVLSVPPAEEPREMTLDQALRRIRFPVLLPTALPQGTRLVRCALSAPDPPQWLLLSYVVDPGAFATLEITQGPRVLADEPEEWPDWRSESGDGTELRVRESRSGSWHQAMALMTLADTAAMVSSNLPLDTVVAVALSLEQQV